MVDQGSSFNPGYPDNANGLTPRQGDSASILVIDDTVDISDILENVLSAEGWECHSAPDAEQGLAYALANPPDLILLDVTLPDMDGFEVCRRLRDDNKTADIPIIFLTAHARAHERVQGLDAGGNDYIVKPFNIDELLARVRVALRTKSAQDILRQANTQLVTLAQTDPLTGLHNRRYLDDRLGEEVVRALRYGYPLSCCLLDVDNFKTVNDTYGHQDGDQVLRRLGNILRDHVRRDDLVARYGGEEFIILLIQQDQQGAISVAENPTINCRDAVSSSQWHDPRRHRQYRGQFSPGLLAWSGLHRRRRRRGPLRGQECGTQSGSPRRPCAVARHPDSPHVKNGFGLHFPLYSLSLNP